MKYRKRSIIYKLLAGLTVLMCSCAEKKPVFEFLQAASITFPSASGVEFYNNNLFVFGDDAPYLLILSRDYHPVDSIFYQLNITGRIPKDEKPDIESATLVFKNDEAVLYGFGSLSTALRRETVVINLNTEAIRRENFFQNKPGFPGIASLNIEGSCTVDNRLVFANRANLSNPINHLIFINPDSSITTKKILLPAGRIVAGISGLYYLQEKDLLIFTASEEETASTFEDGAIGDSYIGWIADFSDKMKAGDFEPDRYEKLSGVDEAFKKQKVESVCVEKVGSDQFIFHMAADNDNGSSTLFKLRIHL